MQFDAVKLEYEKQIMQMAQAIYAKGSEHNEKLMKMSETRKKAITEADESISKLNEKISILENIKHEDGRKMDDLMQSLRRKDDQIEVTTLNADYIQRNFFFFFNFSKFSASCQIPKTN